MNQSRVKPNSDYKDINIFTLLANEATGDAGRLLAKYGKQKASSYGDLEAKLTELYYKTPQKIEMEREMVEIHPHKNWILKHTKPVETREITKEAKKEPEQIVSENGLSVQTAGYVNAEGECDCPECVLERAEELSNASGDCGCHSSLDGITTQKNHTPIIVAGIVTAGAVAITALVLYFKHRKKA